MDCTDEEVAALLASNEFPPLKNDTIIRVANKEKVSRLPIWIMRQAGRYLPEFLEFRQKHSFFDICQSPKLACEVTLMPIRRYDLDAAIIFSDILVVPQSLGMEVKMEKDKGPVFTKPLTLETLGELQWDNAVDRLTYVGQAIRLTRHKLEGKVPIFGFSAAPWTLMCYMIEGGGTKTASKSKKWLYANPDKSHDLLEKLSDVIAQYFVMQVEYGAQLLQVFESSAEYLNTAIYNQFMIPVLRKIRTTVLSTLKSKGLSPVPMIYFAKGGSHLLKAVNEIGFDVLGLDWNARPSEIREQFKDTVFQGNLDPCALYSDKETLIKHVDDMVKEFGTKNYIVNLGHGIYPDAPTEAVSWFIEQIHSYKC